MAEALSQKEIDELLASMLGGGGDDPADSGPAAEEVPVVSAQQEVLVQAPQFGQVAAPKPQQYLSVKAYDFATAARFPKEQVRTFQIVFDNFAQLLASQLSAQLRTTVECEVLQIEENNFGDYSSALPDPIILAVISARPMAGSLLFAVHPECAYMFINRLLGGNLGETDTEKPFSEIDIALVDRVLRQVCRCFTQSWERIVDLDTTVESIDTSTQYTQVTTLSEATMVIMVAVKIDGEEGIMSFCIPHTAIEPIARELVARNYYTASEDIDDETREMFRETMRGRMERTKVDLKAYFAGTQATVDDLANLRVGDVIRLNHPITDPLYVRVAHIPKFRGKIGSLGKNYAVQVSEIIQEDTSNELNPS
ncbi:MAG: flagellar motor switch protein FliM [Oscillospiraceae bacterium]|nr:flagellar motor switch protein FliM [Oscillospiraceae bacterium]